MLLTRTAHGTRIGQVRSLERDAQATCVAADAKLTQMNSDANEVAELRSMQAASDLFLQELTAE